MRDKILVLERILAEDLEAIDRLFSALAPVVLDRDTLRRSASSSATLLKAHELREIWPASIDAFLGFLRGLASVNRKTSGH